MNQEIELKLKIDPKEITKLYNHSVIIKYAENKTPLEQDINNIYFDTPKKELIQLGYVLRLRIIGNQAFQTLKSAEQSKKGIHKRAEWNIELPAPHIDISFFPKKIQKILIPFAKSLRPLFTTHFHRKTWIITINQSVVELALDKGTISADKLKEEFCEIELELKSGKPELLWKIAKQLQKDIHLIVENKSKAERGYKLAHQKKSINSQRTK